VDPRQENLTFIGPAGTGKSHALIALGPRRRRAGPAGPLLHRRRARREPLPRPGRQQRRQAHRDRLRHDLIICDEVGFAPLDSTGSQLLFRFVAAAYERRSLAIASHWPFEEWGRFLPEHSTAVSLLDRLLHHNNIVATDGESYRMREARSRSGGRPSSR
jgi:DNA replication protein DnaC